jgi:hypothetical protein
MGLPIVSNSRDRHVAERDRLFDERSGLTEASAIKTAEEVGHKLTSIGDKKLIVKVIPPATITKVL